MNYTEVVPFVDWLLLHIFDIRKPARFYVQNFISATDKKDMSFVGAFIMEGKMGKKSCFLFPTAGLSKKIKDFFIWFNKMG